MHYKAPFYSVGKAIYSALSNMDIEWFDSSASADDVEEFFKEQSQYSYGILGTSTADAIPNKDTVIWECSTMLEIYSNYKGRKVITKNLEDLLNYLSSQDGWDAIQRELNDEGYVLIAITVGSLSVNMPMFGDYGVWQSGTTSVQLKIQQV